MIRQLKDAGAEGPDLDSVRAEAQEKLAQVATMRTDSLTEGQLKNATDLLCELLDKIKVGSPRGIFDKVALEQFWQVIAEAQPPWLLEAIVDCQDWTSRLDSGMLEKVGFKDFFCECFLLAVSQKWKAIQEQKEQQLITQKFISAKERAKNGKVFLVLASAQDWLININHKPEELDPNKIYWIIKNFENFDPKWLLKIAEQVAEENEFVWEERRDEGTLETVLATDFLSILAVQIEGN